ncbi:hypothetical protein JTB14_012898 [Gonioctena quinquepunctata]|nr:hypothetical protein JTB14_012898 [Gonioctena quinquepunctata]
MIFDNQNIALSERIVLLKQSNNIILDRHQSTKLTTSLGWNRRSSDESKPFKTPNTESPAFTAKGVYLHSKLMFRHCRHQISLLLIRIFPTEMFQLLCIKLLCRQSAKKSLIFAAARTVWAKQMSSLSFLKRKDLRIDRQLLDKCTSSVDPKSKTTSGDLTSVLSPLFPGVECDRLKTRFPNLYSSFEIIILESNVEEAMDFSIWSEGTWVNKIFVVELIFKEEWHIL